MIMTMELHISILHVTPLSLLDEVMIWIWKYNPSKKIAIKSELAITKIDKSCCKERFVETHVIFERLNWFYIQFNLKFKITFKSPNNNHVGLLENIICSRRVYHTIFHLFYICKWNWLSLTSKYLICVSLKYRVSMERLKNWIINYNPDDVVSLK